ncbi:hypothetical protein KKG44_01445 [Patescibacteria group bacterium]|nr:hypothetical protein [Patescibacteria group bacterium]MBU2459763.1 hypothetical protein [Patescibacteria group bacterium]MBU2544275.1 hypothetical protein [Patescibacteria group bacterium]
MQKLFAWCKQYWLIVTGCLLLAFIPLYPKLPLLDVFQTWVYIRLEDFLVAIAMLLLVLMLWRQKLFPNTPLTIPIIIYWLVGLVSLTVAVVSVHPALSEFRPHLGMLHFLRRIEYMGLFFIGYFAFVKKPKKVSAVIWTLVVTTLLIVAYGFGQKFLGFPAFLTMNEEFSKGIPLRLPPTARIPSTFGGHYDLAAYLVFVIPIFGALVFGADKFWQKFVFLAASILSLVLLLFTASRISFGVYLIAISVMLVWKRKPLYILPVIIVSFLLLSSVSTASERFYKTFRFSDVVIDLSTGQPIGTLESLEGGKAKIEMQESPDTESLPKGSEFISVPQVSAKPTKTFKTIEVYTSSPLATGSGEIATVSGSFLVQKAFVYDISITTRFQGQWPKAMTAFKRNILLGGGYSTLSVASDGDYLRMLGETGVLGTAAFLGILIMAFVLFFRRGTKLSNISESFVTGVFAGLVGLLVNAVLIDVFEASKVAFPFWFLMGVSVALLRSTPGERVSYREVWRRVLSSRASVVFAIFIAVLTLYGNALTLYFLGDDFTWLRWAASTITSDIPKYFTDSGGFFYRPIPKIAYFLLYTFFWLKPWGYHITSLLLFTLLSVLMFVLLEKRGVRRWIAFGSSLLFVSLSIHHENVIWVSGLSGMLASVFTMLAITLLTVSENRNRRITYITWVGIWVCAGLATLSYEGGIVAPILVWYVSWFVFGIRSAGSTAILIIVPWYWWARSAAGAVSPGGDYSVRMSRFFVNSIGNAAGYISATIGGPRMVELFASWRAAVRQSVLFTGVAALMALFGTVVLGFKYLQKIVREYRASLVWLGAFGIALLPFIGLGTIAERYGMLASVFMVIAIGEFVEKIWKTNAGLLRWVVVSVFVGVIGWNSIELTRVMGDWQKASNVSQATILTLKRNFFPLKDKQTFIFVNTPIRYGRAWIFPTGLSDAMWHMFKFNAFPYLVYSSPGIEEAFKITTPIGIPAVLVFEDMVLKMAQHKTQVVEVDNP